MSDDGLIYKEIPYHETHWDHGDDLVTLRDVLVVIRGEGDPPFLPVKIGPEDVGREILLPNLTRYKVIPMEYEEGADTGKD